MIKFIIACATVLIIAMTVMIIYLNGDDLANDEVFSMGFANNVEFLFMGQGTIETHSENGWVTGDFIRSYYAVDEGERFNIINSVRQARDDVHPPLFFMLLNVVCSLNPKDVSTFPGHLINFIVGIVMFVMVYMLSLWISKDKWSAFVPVILLIGSAAMEDEITYIRMYASLCAIVLIYMFLCLLLTDEKYDSKWLYIGLGLTTTIGTLTHYYYYVMCFAVAAVTYVILITQKRRKVRIKFFICQLLGSAVSFCAYPYVFRHMLHSERGEQAMENLNSTDAQFYKDHLIGFADTYNKEIFNGRFLICICIMLVLLIVAFVVSKNKKEKKEDVKDKSVNINGILILGVSSLVYWMILFKVSYSTRWLYISPTFAPFIILFGVLLVSVLRIIFSQKGIIIALILAMIFSFAYLKVSIPERIEKRNILETRERIITYTAKNRDCIFIYDEWSTPHHGQDLYLMKYDQVYFISADDFNECDIASMLEGRKDNEKDIAVFVRTNIPDAESMAQRVCDASGGKEVSLIDDYQFFVYNINR